MQSFVDCIRRRMNSSCTKEALGKVLTIVLDYIYLIWKLYGALTTVHTVCKMHCTSMSVKNLSYLAHVFGLYYKAQFRTFIFLVLLRTALLKIRMAVHVCSDLCFNKEIIFWYSLLCQALALMWTLMTGFCLFFKEKSAKERVQVECEWRLGGGHSTLGHPSF